MIRAVLRRVGIFAATALISSAVVFLLLSLLPGDLAQVMLGTSATDDQVAQLRERLGLDQPLVIRYLDWLGGFVTGNLGTSQSSGVSLASEIGRALSVTGWLVAAAMLLALLIAVPAGTWSALHRTRIDGVLVSLGAQLGISIPGFLAGALLIAIFSVGLGALPSGGWADPGDDFPEFLRRLILPALSLALVQGAVLARFVRSAVLDVLREDWMRTARATGLTRQRALTRHGMRNAAIPVLTLLGLQLSSLLIGAVPVERVFVLPGLGTLLLDKVSQRDLPSVQTIVMVLVLLILSVNFAVDLVSLLIDPRLRSERRQFAPAEPPREEAVA